MSILKALEKHPTYENFEACCPHCKKWSIYNRASDLKTFRLVTGQTVRCQNTECGKEFSIGGDLINPAWQMILMDCEVLKQQRRYSSCVLNLAQAFEIYFALFLRVELVYKPYGIEKSYDLDRRNELSVLLFEITRKWTFFPLRNIFIALLLKQSKPNTMTESEVVIKSLPSIANTEPSDEAIFALPDQKLSEILLELKKSTVSSLRNNVVHKDAYRPTIEEVEKAIEESSRILYRLEHCLNVLMDQPWFYESL